ETSREPVSLPRSRTRAALLVLHSCDAGAAVSLDSASRATLRSEDLSRRAHSLIDALHRVRVDILVSFAEQAARLCAAADAAIGDCDGCGTRPHRAYRRGHSAGTPASVVARRVRGTLDRDSYHRSRVARRPAFRRLACRDFVGPRPTVRAGGGGCMVSRLV